jgi:hypothetical protein
MWFRVLPFLCLFLLAHQVVTVRLLIALAIPIVSVALHKALGLKMEPLF